MHMSDLLSRLGPKPGEIHSKTWKRPGIPSPSNGTNVWDTSDTTNEGDSDTGNYNDYQGSIYSHPPHPSTSPSSLPSTISLLNRLMDTPIFHENVHDRPQTGEPRKVSKSLLERVGRTDDGPPESQKIHNIDGMDIEQDNDEVVLSERRNRDYSSKTVEIALQDHSNQRTFGHIKSSASGAQNQASPSTRETISLSDKKGNLNSQPPLVGRMQDGFAPPDVNFTSPSKLNSTNYNLQMNSNVMPHEIPRPSKSAEDSESHESHPPDQVRDVLLPLMLQNAECRIQDDELKTTLRQQTTINPKVITDQVCASFSELGQTIRNEMEYRDPPRRSSPRADPRKGSTDASPSIASPSTEKRVGAPLDAPDIAHHQKSSAYNQNVEAVSNSSSMPSTSFLPFPQSESASKVSQPQDSSQRAIPHSQDKKDQDRERRRTSESSHYDGRRRSRSPPRGLPDKPNVNTYAHERRLPNHEYDDSRPRYLSDERRYRASPERRTRSDSRDRAPFSNSRRGRHSHRRGFSRDDDHYAHRFPPRPTRGTSRSYNRSRSPIRRGQRTPPRDRSPYYSRGRSPPRRGPRTPPPRRGSSRSPSRHGSYQTITRSPPTRGPRTRTPTRRSSVTSTISHPSDGRHRPNERMESRDHSVAISTTSMNTLSKEPVTQTTSTSESHQPNQETQETPSSLNAENVQEVAEPSQPILPCHNVPGLWFVKLALDSLGTLSCNFEIDHETALKWNIGRTNNQKAAAADNHSVQVSRKKLSLQVCSFPKQLVQDVIEQLSTEQTPATIASAIFSLEQRWPNQGQLIVKVNPDTGKKGTWLPNKLGLNNAPILIQDYVQEGDNVVQFIQLSGMSENLFVLCASENED